MNLSADNFILIGAILIFVSIMTSRASAKFGIPILLLFLIVGMVFGSDGFGIQFYNANIAQFIGMIALSIILFSGGMDTSFKEIRPIVVSGIVLSTVGVLLTAFITGLFIYWISSFTFTNIYLPLASSLLLASTMSSTDSASVFNLLRSQKIQLKNNLRPILELESGSNDPMAYMLTIALIQYITSSDVGIGNVAYNFFIQIAIGGCIGYLVGKLCVLLINKFQMPYPSLYSLLLLSVIFFTFSITDMLKGNGYLAVYIAGIIVGNKQLIYKKEISSFLESMTMLSQIIMFLSLGLLVNPHEMIHIIPIAILIGFFMIIIARPITVFSCLLPFKNIHWRSKIFISWVGLRGAVPIIFATYPVVANVEYSDQIFNIVFVITLISLIVQGMSITSIAKCLKLDMPYEEPSNHFGVELPDDLNILLNEIKLTKEMLAQTQLLKDMKIPPRTLVALVKRKNQIFIPNGMTELKSNDILLVISEDDQDRFSDYWKSKSFHE